MRDVKRKAGILLVNTGTPQAPTPEAVKAFLREFLSDPFILDMPAPARWLLLHGVILPLRPRRAAEAYEHIWTEEGSPLLAISRRVRDGLRKRLPDMAVELAMRYGQPSMERGLSALRDAQCESILVAPMFPHRAPATHGSVEAEVARLQKTMRGLARITFLPEFYEHSKLIAAWAAIARPLLAEFRPRHVVLSYHGLPERHIRKADATGQCLARPDCCETMTESNRRCYRAQCFATSRALAEALNLEVGTWTTCFQSRMKPGRWLEPSTLHTLTRLAQRGHNRVAVLCPSFVVDCLETLEEVDLRLRAAFLEAGGKALLRVPCLDDDPAWLDGLAATLREAHLPPGAGR